VKRILFTALTLLIAASMANAKVSSQDTNLKVIAPGKALYGQNYSGGPVRIVEVDSAGAIEIDNGAGGVSFSGAVTVDGAATFSNTTSFTGNPTFTSSVTSNPEVSIVNTHAGALSAVLDMEHNSASPADNDDVLMIRGLGYDSESPTTSNVTVYGQIIMESDDVTDATEDGSMVFSTMQDGTLTDILTLDTSALLASATASKPDFNMTNTNADANSATLIIQKDSASPADNDELGDIQVLGDDSGGTATIFAEIEIEAEDVTDTTEDGSIDLQVMKDGTLTSALLLTGGTVTIDAPTGNATLTTGNINISVVIGGTTYYIKANTGE